jgi:hypothetical protein
MFSSYLSGRVVVPLAPRRWSRRHGQATPTRMAGVALSTALVNIGVIVEATDATRAS